MTTQWKITKPRLGSPDHILVSGKIAVGRAGYNGLRSRGDSDDNAYSWRLSLPGTERAGFEAELNNAKFACEQAFKNWLQAAGLAELS